MAVLEIRNLEKTYKKGFFPKPHKALFNVSFKVKEGRVTGFLGGNGAGKTTTMKCFLGLIFPDSGDITYFNGLHLGEEVKARIGFLPERPYFYEYLTGLEFLSFYGRLSTKLSRNDLKERSEKLLKRVDLWHAKDKKLHEYSKGMLQKIGIAQALVHDPEFVILDEPMSGLDPDGRYYVNEIIRETAREGKAVFFSSHLLPDAEKLCEDLVILRGGKVVYEGSTEAFLHTMGEAAIISYFFRGEKKSRRVETDQELQQVLHQLISEGATVVDVKRDRNLEDAFIKIGLRGPEV